MDQVWVKKDLTEQDMFDWRMKPNRLKIVLARILIASTKNRKHPLGFSIVDKRPLLMRFMNFFEYAKFLKKERAGKSEMCSVFIVIFT